MCVKSDIAPLANGELPNQDSFQITVLDERIRELSGEAKRWLDLLRAAANGTIDEIALMNDYLAVANPAFNASPDDTDLLYAIQESEILNNPEVITQNPGY